MKHRRRLFQPCRDFWTTLAVLATAVSIWAPSGHWIEAAIVFAILSETFADDSHN